MSGASAANAPEARLNRTCEACRKRKIKCVPATDNGSPTAKCGRCTKLDIECTFQAPATRRRRKRHEAHIRELEQKLEHVWRLVSTEQRLGPWALPPSGGPTPESINEAFSAPSAPSSSAPASAVPSLTYVSGSKTPATEDPVAQGLVEESLANDLCANFCTTALPHYPLVAVSIPPSWQTFRQNRPALFRAILAAASGCFRPSLSKVLYRNAEQYVTEQAVLSGRKSLDLVQAALLLATWSRPAEKFEDLNFGQFATIAATMVTELRSTNDDRYRLAVKNGLSSTFDQLEIARTFAACYLLCSSIAMSFRRPSTLRHGPWVQHCIEILERDTTSSIGDRRLAAWSRLQMLAEEGLAMAGLDDGSSINPSDPRNGAILEGALYQVKSWGDNLAPDIMSRTLGIHHQTVMLNLRVPGLHETHASRDFRPPFAIRHPSTPQLSTQMSLRFIDARIRCLGIARTIVNLFLEFSTEELQQVPVIVFTRIMFAVVVIIKLEVLGTATSDISYVATAEASSTLDTLHRIVGRLAQASDDSRFCVPATFHAVLQRLTGWCDDIYLNLHMGSDDMIEPLKNLSVDDSRHTPPSPDGEAYGGTPLIDSSSFDIGYTPQDVEADVFANLAAPYHDSFQMEFDNTATLMPWNDNLVDEFFPVNLQ